jgi:DNA polymerase III alpha subunit (gram-positive type)
MSEEERYVSVDVEASGPIPGDFSLLQIGACLAYQPQLGFETLIRPLNDNMNEWVRHNQLELFNRCRESGEEPAVAMERFDDWLKRTVKGRPIFVGFNASFDFKFVDWYFHHFLGYNPFGINAIDIKAYYMGKFATNWGDAVKREIKKKLRISTPHTHDALDDAREQAEIFITLREV